MAKRALGALPVVATLGALLYMLAGKAKEIAPKMKTLEGDDGLEGFKIKRPSIKAVVNTVVNPVAQYKAVQAVAKQNPVANKVLIAASTAVNPVQQLQAVKALAARDTKTKQLFRVAQTFGNPVMQVKLLKDTVKDGYSGKNKIAQWALLASDPVYQQKMAKELMSKQKGGGEQEVEHTDEALTFPYEVEPGIWIDAQANRVNKDGSPWIPDQSLVITDPNTGYSETSVSYGPDGNINNDGQGLDPNAPFYDEYSGMWYSPADDSYYDPTSGMYYDGYMNPVGKNAMNAVVPMTGPGSDPNAPYMDPATGFWYNPKEDSYYDPVSQTYFDGFLNPVGTASNGNPNSVSYRGMPGSDDPETSVEQSMDQPFLDSNSGMIYDPAADTYQDPRTGQMYDGYFNPMSKDDERLQGLGALGKLHIAKGVGKKTVAIVGAAAAVVGCYYAPGGCAAFIGADAMLLKMAYESKKNPADDVAHQQEAQRKAQAVYDEQQRNQLATAQNRQLNLEPKQDPNTGIWFDPKSNSYYNPATREYYDPNTEQYQPMEPADSVPAQY